MWNFDTLATEFVNPCDFKDLLAKIKEHFHEPEHSVIILVSSHQNLIITGTNLSLEDVNFILM